MKFKKSHIVTFLFCWVAVSFGMYFFTQQSLSKQSTNEDYKQYINTEVSSTEFTAEKTDNEEDDIAVEVLKHIDAAKIQDYLVKKLLRKDQ